MGINAEQIQADIAAERERLLAKYRAELAEQDRALVGAGAVHQYCGICDRTFTGSREDHVVSKQHKRRANRRTF